MPEFQRETLAGPASERFLGFLIRQSQQIALCLGRIPSPSGKTEKHLDIAKLLIDELEMIETKTRGNLTPEEQETLAGILRDMRLEFVRATSEDAGENPAPQPSAEAPAPADEEENASKKRFSKSYGS